MGSDEKDNKKYSEKQVPTKAKPGLKSTSTVLFKAGGVQVCDQLLLDVYVKKDKDRKAKGLPPMIAKIT